MKYIIGIDVGTTNTKICLFRLPQFNLVQIERFSTPQIKSGEETDIDSEAVWAGIQEALFKMSSSLSEKDTIVSISIASFAQTIVLQDAKNNVLEPTIAWFDKRGQKEKEEVNRLIGKETLYEITGINAHSHHSLSKLLWIKQNKPDIYKKIKKWTCMSGFIGSRLTGKYVTDVSLASRTMMFDLKSKNWSEQIVDEFKLNYDALPEVIESGIAVGDLLPSIANSLGLPKNTKVTIGGHDHMAGSVCVDLKPGDILNSTGTTEGLLLLSEKPNLTKDFQNKAISNGLYVKQFLYTFYGSMPSAGQSFEWFISIFSQIEKSKERDYSGLKDIYNDNFNTLYNSMCIFIPHLHGSGPPLRNANSKGAIYGIDSVTSKVDLLFSMIAGLCFELKHLKYSYEKSEKKDINSIKVIGPATKNSLWLQMKADILQSEVHAYHIEEAVAKGAAVLTAIKQGILKEPPKANYETYLPNKESVKKLAKFYNEKYLPFYNMKHTFEEGSVSDGSTNLL